MTARKTITPLQDKHVNRTLSTTLLEGGEITLTNPTTVGGITLYQNFDVSAGKGLIVDSSSEEDNPVAMEIEWEAMTGQVADTGASVVNIYIDTNGELAQFPDRFLTPEQTPLYISLTFLFLVDPSQSLIFFNGVPVGMSGVNFSRTITGMYDFMTPISNPRTSQNKYMASENGTSLQLKRTAGEFFALAGNAQNVLTRDIISFDEVDPVTSLIFAFYSGSGDPTDSANWLNAVDPVSESIKPNIYDDGTGAGGTGLPTGVVLPNEWTIQYLYAIQNGLTLCVFGQTKFASKVEAIRNFGHEERFVYPDSEFINNRAALVVRGDCVDLSDPDTASFITMDRFGVSPKSGGIATDQETADVLLPLIQGTVETITSDYTVTDGVTKVIADASGGSIDVTLPAPSNVVGSTYTVVAEGAEPLKTVDIIVADGGDIINLLGAVVTTLTVTGYAVHELLATTSGYRLIK